MDVLGLGLVPTCVAFASNWHESYALGTRSTSYVVDYTFVSACNIHTHMHLARAIGYTVIELRQFSSTSAGIRDITTRQAKHPSLSWILTTLKLTCFFPKEEAPCYLPRVTSEKTLSERNFGVNCLNEKSFFDFINSRLQRHASLRDQMICSVSLYYQKGYATWIKERKERKKERIFLGLRITESLARTKSVSILNDQKDDFSVRWYVLH